MLLAMHAVRYDVSYTVRYAVRYANFDCKIKLLFAKWYAFQWNYQIFPAHSAHCTLYMNFCFELSKYNLFTFTPGHTDYCFALVIIVIKDF